MKRSLTELNYFYLKIWSKYGTKVETQSMKIHSQVFFRFEQIKLSQALDLNTLCEARRNAQGPPTPCQKQLTPSCFAQNYKAKQFLKA
jgi:hypothetical protein